MNLRELNETANSCGIPPEEMAEMPVKVLPNGKTSLRLKSPNLGWSGMSIRLPVGRYKRVIDTQGLIFDLKLVRRNGLGTGGPNEALYELV